ncbi:MAG: GNAT family N-acetyltransferase [Firmicutes bacterium]|nr:GNAT family N-acetyltransferase [Bacillota bacterium]
MGTLFAVREFQVTDVDQIVTLFFETVHAINASDYTVEQLAAWAPKLSVDERQERIQRLRASLSHNISYVAVRGDTIVGFADVTTDGYVDHLFVHKDFQGQGIASDLLLLHRVEQEALGHGVKQIRTDASITAKPFFEHKGYVAVCAQTVSVRGVSMGNFKMTKGF